MITSNVPVNEVGAIRQGSVYHEVCELKNQVEELTTSISYLAELLAPILSAEYSIDASDAYTTVSNSEPPPPNCELATAIRQLKVNTFSANNYLKSLISLVYLK
jgi:hypothetical protein